jgi:L-ribulose-5-phosphate 3-epimerase
LLLAYNTNGFAHHDPSTAIGLLAEIGYRGVGLTIDNDLLNPFQMQNAIAKALPNSTSGIRKILDALRLRSVIETGARFLLDFRRKHEPTLMTADRLTRARRIEFYRDAIDIARELQSDCVSIWSGTLRDSVADDAAFERLIDGLRQVCDYADSKSVAIGFEPEPGMFIDRMERFEQLLERFDAPPLKLTLDIGHLHCMGDIPIAEQIHRWSGRLANVHIEDMRRGVHEHLMFGEGEIDFRPVIAELKAVNYQGLVQVELSRHSHMAPEAARQAFEFLEPLVN